MQSTLEKQLERIITKLESIEKRLEELEKSSNIMTNHISFVEGIYDKIKSPFHYILDTVQTKLLPPANLIVINDRRSF